VRGLKGENRWEVDGTGSASEANEGRRREKVTTERLEK
jgi:hypothetical protein